MNEQELKQARLDFLNETVQYYSEDVKRRAVENVSCRYKTRDGKKCALGRWIPDNLYNENIEGCGVEDLISRDLLPDNIKILGAKFLMHVQRLHDFSGSWDKTRLTENGIDYVEEIKRQYCQ